MWLGPPQAQASRQEEQKPLIEELGNLLLVPQGEGPLEGSCGYKAGLLVISHGPLQRWPGL